LDAGRIFCTFLIYWILGFATLPKSAKPNTTFAEPEAAISYHNFKIDFFYPAKEFRIYFTCSGGPSIFKTGWD
jgi:hypothetical protein